MVVPRTKLMRSILGKNFHSDNVEEWRKFREKNAQKCIHSQISSKQNDGAT